MSLGDRQQETVSQAAFLLLISDSCYTENMKTTDPEKPDLSAHAFFFGGAVILLMVALITVASQSFTRPTITLGSCQFKTELAETSQQKAQGLAGRQSISKDQAMIFDFKQEQPSFWMKGMLFPLDIIWVSGNKVIDIDANAPVDDGAVQYEPSQPIDWVIEIAAGQAQTCGVTPNTLVKGLQP